MSILGFDELWEKLRTGDESVEIEAKRAEEVGKSILESISAFANEPDRGGGYLLLGVATSEDALFPDYEVTGIPNPNKVQADLATQCRTAFNVLIRPDITVEQHQDVPVLVVYIPEARPQDKPVYIQRKGVNKGTYRRIGSTDQICTDDDLALFYQARGQQTYDETPIPDSSLDDIDPQALTGYRRLRSERGAESELLAYSDEDLLYALGAMTRDKGQTCLTVAGLLLFGKMITLRRHLPMTRVDYIRVEGREWVPDPDKRYQSIEKLGPLMLTVRSLVAQILDDIPKAFALSEDGLHRKDLPLVPRKVIREALVNALMHRSYQKHRPVQVIRYANRIEIHNPGYSLVPDDRLGEPGSVLRNPKIAAVLHDVGLAETKGTGIRSMREAMEMANLTQPLFESDRIGETFTVRLLVHHLLSEEDWRWLSRFKDCNLTDDDARGLIIAREIGAIDNRVCRSITRVDTLTASNRLRRLRDLGLLEQKGQGRATYYVPTKRLVGAQESIHQVRSVEPSPVDKGQKDVPDRVDKGQPTGLNPVDKAQAMGLGPLPSNLSAAIQTAGRRAAPNEVKAVILKLCAWKPLRSSQLEALLHRSTKYLKTQYLQPMIQAGELEYLYPTNPAHPRQAYRATGSDNVENEK